MKTRVLLVVLLLLAAMGFLLWNPSGDKALRTSYYLPDLTTVQANQAEIHALAGHFPYPYEHTLSDTYHRLGLSEFDGHDRMKTQQNRDEMMSAASVFAATNGIMAYMAVGYREYEKFHTALTKVLKAANKTGIPAVRYIYGHQNNIWVHTLATVAGDFLEHAITNGLVSHNMKQSDYLVAQSLFLYRWTGFLGLTQKEAAHYLPPSTISTGLGWLAERGTDVPYIKKMLLLHMLEAVEPAYPSGKVRMLLLIRAGKWDRAWRIWRFEKKNAIIDKKPGQK